MKKKLRYQCLECDERFISWQKRNEHRDSEHPEPVPPKITVTYADCNNLSTQLKHTNLLGGRMLEVGDVFYNIEKCVIKMTKYTEDSDDMYIGYEVTKSIWKKDKPI